TNARTRHLWRYIRLGIGLVLIILLVPTLANPGFWSALAAVNLPLVVLALALAFASMVAKSWRWGVIMHWRGIKLSQGYFMVMYLVGIFFNNFLPSGMGGDVVRAYETARDTGRGAESFSTVLIERGGGMLVVFGIGGLFALTTGDALPIAFKLLAVGLFLGGLIAVWALWLDVTGKILAAVGARLPRQLSGIWLKIMRVYEEFRLYRHEWRLFRSIILLSLVSTIVGLASTYSLLLAYGKPMPPFAAFAAFFGIESAIEVLPISLNSLGVREGAYVFFLSKLTPPVSNQVALGVSLLVRLIILIHAAAGGIAYLIRNARGRSMLTVSNVNISPAPNTVEELPSSQP
ncbi:MAG TPA: lysylphosphatidylglycerol synthase transmembrane domain-containing protein, partial [Aggregatilineales bacterium]|nr:lysylphosphatidylglycerol synthase transmembrane domain-containing protein [Aggregatilineales bacterium]